jgi:Tol biopolymer transport system component
VPTSLTPSYQALRSEGQLVFEVGDITEPARLRTLRPDLSSEEFLPDQSGLQRRATWKPDGTRVAFVLHDLSDLSPRAMIWEAAADGSDVRMLSEGCDPPVCVEESDPGYSPDGSQLVFVRTRADDNGQPAESLLAVRNLETGVVTDLEATSRPVSEALLSHPRWSPDGETIAYAVATLNTDAVTSGSAIHLVGADGTDDRALTLPELEAGDPEWAPDGSTLLFSSQPIRVYAALNLRDPDRMHLYTMSVDGSDVRQLPVHGPVGAASWTTGGEQILFSYIESMGEFSPGLPRLFAMDDDGSNVLPITSLSTPAWYAIQQPVP